MSPSQIHAVGTADVARIEAPVSVRAYLICAFASFGGILFGYDSGYISGVLGMVSSHAFLDNDANLTGNSGLCEADHGSCCSNHRAQSNGLHLVCLSAFFDCVYPLRWHLLRRAYWRPSSRLDWPSYYHHELLSRLCYWRRHPGCSFCSQYACRRPIGCRSGSRWSISRCHPLRFGDIPKASSRIAGLGLPMGHYARLAHCRMRQSGNSAP